MPPSGKSFLPTFTKKKKPEQVRTHDGLDAPDAYPLRGPTRMGKNIFRIDRARAIRPLSQSTPLPSPCHVHACSAQLVKLAVGCLNELAPVHDDHWAHCEEDDGPSVGASSSGHGPGGVAHKMAGLSLGRSSGGAKDELGVSTSHASISSVGSARSAGSAGSSSGQQPQQQQRAVMGRQGSGGSDAGGGGAVLRRPSFLLGLLGKKESSGSGAEPNSGASSSVPTGSKSGMGAFFSDSGKKSGSVSATSPHGTGLSHSGFGRWVTGQCLVNAWWDVCAMTGITDRKDENVPTVEMPATATISQDDDGRGPRDGAADEAADADEAPALRGRGEGGGQGEGPGASRFVPSVCRMRPVLVRALADATPLYINTFEPTGAGAAHHRVQHDAAAAGPLHDAALRGAQGCRYDLLQYGQAQHRGYVRACVHGVDGSLCSAAGHTLPATPSPFPHKPTHQASRTRTSPRSTSPSSRSSSRGTATRRWRSTAGR